MPSSKSSVDNRDVYYRLGKSAGYRARSAYKLLHLDEEFGLFEGVKTAVDLCAAPGSWSQVLGQELKPGKGPDDPKVVSVDLQPMAPLPNITILQTDITLPSTIPLVLNALGGRKADLVVCDGAPDVTGVHDLDAYLHSQLLLAALTLSLTLLAPGATLIFKIFLSPLDPKAAMLKSQLELFFPRSRTAETHSTYAEFDETAGIDGQAAGRIPWEAGVWVRKPRSSRSGSGEAFIVCRGFDPSKVPLPVVFPPEALADLAKQTTGTLTLESLAHLTPNSASSAEWGMIKAYVGSGDLGSRHTNDTKTAKPELTLSITDGVSRNSSVKSIKALHPQPTPCDEPDEYFAANASNLLAPKRLQVETKKRSASLTVDPNSRKTSLDSLNTPVSATSAAFEADRPWEKGTTPLPTPKKHGSPDGLLSAREWDIARSTPREDGAVSPALSSGSKTDLFFASTQSEILPAPPRPISRSPILGKGLPNGIRGHDRTVSMPAMKPGPEAAVETLVSPKPYIDAIRRPFRADIFGSPGSPRIVSQDIPSGPLSTLPTYPDMAPLVPPPSRPVHNRRESQQLPREIREVPSDQTVLTVGQVLLPSSSDRQWPPESKRKWTLVKPLGEGAFSSVWSAKDAGTSTTAAVKLTSRATCATNSRTRIAFLREVSVLRHLSHPAIVSFLGSFSTASHHCLVLEELSGGELFDLINDDANYDRLLLPGPGDDVGEGVVRRIFGELARGVAWLHEVGVVHRDIKLENMLFTVNPFKLPPTSTNSIPLDLLPTPLVKLTDFGLSRFINPQTPLLQTRCGSESFAAPEIIMGKSYDGRQTDAWAMGVVLYTLTCGELPFDEKDNTSIRTEREERKRKMMRIAKGQYDWRDDIGSEGPDGVRAVVKRLLVRDPKVRMRVMNVWEMGWMRGPGGVSPPSEGMERVNGVNGVDGEYVFAGSMGKGKRVLDGFLLDEEVEAEAQAEAV